MLKIEERLIELRNRGEKALIPFFTIGYPDVGRSLEMIKAAAEAGANIIEAGIPFSDPIADGPSIQFSSQEALQNGVTLRGALDALTTITEDLDVPIVIMSYYNPILSMGLDTFSEIAASIPVSGVIIPDLPPEESEVLEGLLREKEIDTIYLVAPTSSSQRIRMITSRSSGFVYAVSVTGVTGARRELPREISSFLTATRRSTEKPICVGFGISTKEHAVLLAPQADGIIIGSAIVDIIRKNPSDPVTPVSLYLKEMKGVLTG